MYSEDCFKSKGWQMNQVKTHHFNYSFFKEAKSLMEKWFHFFQHLMQFFQSRLDLDEKKLDLKLINNYDDAKIKILELLDSDYDKISIQVQNL